MIVVSHRGPFLFSIEEDGTIAANRGPGGLAGTLHAARHVRRTCSKVRAAYRRRAQRRRPCRARTAREAAARHRRRVRRRSTPCPPAPLRGRLQRDPVVPLPRALRPASAARRSTSRSRWRGTRTSRSTRPSPTPSIDAPRRRRRGAGAGLPPRARAGDACATARPDLLVSYFTHTPFCGPSSIRVLPDRVAEAICASLASVPVGFHTTRWARAYMESVREVLGSRPRRDVVVHRAPRARPRRLRRRRRVATQCGGGSGVRRRGRRTEADLPHRPHRSAKNIVRGFVAYDHLLTEPARVAREGGLRRDAHRVAREPRRSTSRISGRSTRWPPS